MLARIEALLRRPLGNVGAEGRPEQYCFGQIGSGPFPAVVLVHGSGPATRAGNRPLVAPCLARGIAVLSYDKRGTGGSGGPYRGVGPLNSDSMIRLLAGDAVAGLELLARHSRIDPTRLGLAGGSQAGWIIPNAAARFPVRFSVMLSGPLVSVGEENHFSRAFEGSTLPLDKVDRRSSRIA